MSRSLFRSFATALILFVSITSNAQTTGYIVRAIGDTVRGTFPGYRPRVFNTQTVNFNDGAGARTYTVADLKGYSIDGADEYRSYEGNRMVNSLVVETGGAEQRSEHYQIVSTFLRVFAKAKGYTFYVLNDAVRINFFYASEKDTVTELKHWVFADPYRPQNIETGIFRTQLTRLLDNDPGRIAYEEDALRIWITAVAGVAKPKERQRKADEGWIVMGGMTFNEFETKGLNSSKDYQGNQSLYLSAGYLVRISHRFQNLFLLPQVSRHSYSATGQTTSSHGETEIISGKGSGLAVGIYVGIRIVSKPGVKVFVAPGMDALVYLDNTLSYKYEYPPSYAFAHRKANEIELKSLCMSPRLMAGAELKRFWIWGAYRLSTSISEYRLLGVQLSGLQAGVGYRF